MRMSAKAEYAVRAMVELATVDEGVLVKTDDLAAAQGIPPQFLVDILSALRTAPLLGSLRGGCQVPWAGRPAITSTRRGSGATAQSGRSQLACATGTRPRRSAAISRAGAFCQLCRDRCGTSVTNHCHAWRATGSRPDA